ncbi:hypothetical protein K438DRAFT_731984 [Mycena galopus ATCC 62051]|nr:hypothetical protein K438DRAFT_731984 [Mycena galopus ATCC 62051]
MPRSRTTRRARAGSKCISLRAWSARIVLLIDSTTASSVRRRRSGRERVPSAPPRGRRAPPIVSHHVYPRHNEVPPMYSTDDRRRPRAGAAFEGDGTCGELGGDQHDGRGRMEVLVLLSRTHSPALAPRTSSPAFLSSALLPSASAMRMRKAGWRWKNTLGDTIARVRPRTYTLQLSFSAATLPRAAFSFSFPFPFPVLCRRPRRVLAGGIGHHFPAAGARA